MLIDKIEVFGARCKSYVLESILKASIQICSPFLVKYFLRVVSR